MSAKASDKSANRSAMMAVNWPSTVLGPKATLLPNCAVNAALSSLCQSVWRRLTKPIGLGPKLDTSGSYRHGCGSGAACGRNDCEGHAVQALGRVGFALIACHGQHAIDA